MDEEWEDVSDDDNDDNEDDNDDNDEINNINEENKETNDKNNNQSTNSNDTQPQQNPSYQALQEIIESTGEENLYPPLDGTSFYKTICRINHSCVPNVMVRYISHPAYGLCAEMVTLKDIEENEELVQSYIDNTLGMLIYCVFFISYRYFMIRN